MKKITLFIWSLVFSLGLIGCDSFLDIEPEGKVIPETQEDFRALLTQAYVAYPNHKSLTALRTDELKLDRYSLDFLDIRDIYLWKDQGQDKQTVEFPWSAFYNAVFYANHVILEGDLILPDTPEKEQLMGEAYALRAYAFFDLVNLYAKPFNPETSSTDKAIPLTLEIDLENVLEPETTKQVYQQIHQDIHHAKDLLNVTVQEPGHNYRFSHAAIHAFEARVYLYEQNWEAALASVAKAMEYKSELEDLNSSNAIPTNFLSKESILALENTFSSTLKRSTMVSDELIEAYDSDKDLRFALYFEENEEEYKAIKVGEIETKVSLRTAELYFIKAEAEARLDRLSDAKNTLQEVLIRRYRSEASDSVLEDMLALDKEGFIAFLLEERYKEFALEGHRWFDLRRANQKQLHHFMDDTEYILNENDPRYTLPYPESAKRNNPNL